MYLAAWASEGGKGDLDLLDFEILYFPIKLLAKKVVLLVSSG